MIKICVNNIDKICFNQLLQKNIMISEKLKTTIKVVLNKISNEKVNNQKN